MLELVCNDLTELSQVASAVIKNAKGRNCWTLNASMGSGKTTTIAEICKQLGVIDYVSSPTYGLVNEYRTKENKIIYHFDFYRIKSDWEAMEIGIDEYFFSGNLCIVEWGEKIINLLPEDVYNIEIINNNHNRIFKLY